MLAGSPANHDISKDEAASAEQEADKEIQAWVDAAENEQAALLQRDEAVQTAIPEEDLMGKPIREKDIDSDEENARHEVKMKDAEIDEFVDAAEEMSGAKTEDWASVYTSLTSTLRRTSVTGTSLRRASLATWFLRLLRPPRRLRRPKVTKKPSTLCWSSRWSMILMTSPLTSLRRSPSPPMTPWAKIQQLREPLMPQQKANPWRLKSGI